MRATPAHPRGLRGLGEDTIVRLGVLHVEAGRGILTRMTVQENLGYLAGAAKL